MFFNFTYDACLFDTILLHNDLSAQFLNEFHIKYIEKWNSSSKKFKPPFFYITPSISLNGKSIHFQNFYKIIFRDKIVIANKKDKNQSKIFPKGAQYLSEKFYNSAEKIQSTNNHDRFRKTKLILMFVYLVVNRDLKFLDLNKESIVLFFIYSIEIEDFILFF